MCYTSTARIDFYLWEKESSPQNRVKTIGANANIYDIFCKRRSREQWKKVRPLLNSVLTCNCHSSSLQLSPTIFLAVSFDRFGRGTEVRRIKSRDRFQLRSLQQKDRAARLWPSIFCSPRRVGESLDFRDDRLRLFTSSLFSRSARSSCLAFAEFSLFKRQR